MNLDKQVYEIIDEVNERLDVFLVNKLQNLSRSHIQKMIVDGHITVNQKQMKANYKLRKADNVEFIMPEAKEVEILAEAIPLDVLYEDNDLIVINKKRGMVVHPATGVYTGTLVNALLSHCEDLSGINGEIRPGIVHRLDKDTSGVMVAAKNDIAHISLAKQIKEKTATRQYLAIVHGNIKEDEGIIEGAIGRDANDRKKMAIVFENGKSATTKFKVIERFGKYTLVECNLMTGRTHQIRVHMTYIGHPLVGDPKYGSSKCPFKINGQALHSKNLKFIHPRTNKEMFFSSPLPEDMEKILKNIRRIK
ncbi:MAG: pseudouridine synthase, RluA family [Firmicutes bacterium]|nr:pseudouridine synthase, RluA family [Bacillota bacterium]